MTQTKEGKDQHHYNNQLTSRARPTRLSKKPTAALFNRSPFKLCQALWSCKRSECTFYANILVALTGTKATFTLTLNKTPKLPSKEAATFVWPLIAKAL